MPITRAKDMRRIQNNGVQPARGCCIDQLLGSPLGPNVIDPVRVIEPRVLFGESALLEAPDDKARSVDQPPSPALLAGTDHVARAIDIDTGLRFILSLPDIGAGGHVKDGVDRGGHGFAH